MPRCSSSAAVPGCPENPAAPSRRSLLAGVAVLGLPLMPTPSPAADDADAVILALVAEALENDQRCDEISEKIAALEMADLPVPREYEAALEDLCDAYKNTRNLIVASRPQTIAGVRAILKFVRREIPLDDDPHAGMMDALLACQALAMEGGADV